MKKQTNKMINREDLFDKCYALWSVGIHSENEDEKEEAIGYLGKLINAGTIESTKLDDMNEELENIKSLTKYIQSEKVKYIINK